MVVLIAPRIMATGPVRAIPPAAKGIRPRNKGGIDKGVQAVEHQGEGCVKGHGEQQFTNRQLTHLFCVVAGRVVTL